MGFQTIVPDPPPYSRVSPKLSKLQQPHPFYADQMASMATVSHHEGLLLEAPKNLAPALDHLVQNPSLRAFGFCN